MSEMTYDEQVLGLLIKQALRYRDPKIILAFTGASAAISGTAHTIERDDDV